MLLVTRDLAAVLLVIHWLSTPFAAHGHGCAVATTWPSPADCPTAGQGVRSLQSQQGWGYNSTLAGQARRRRSRRNMVQGWCRKPARPVSKVFNVFQTGSAQHRPQPLTLLHMLHCPAHAAQAAPGATKVSQCLMKPGMVSCLNAPAAHSTSAGPQVPHPRLALPQAHAGTDTPSPLQLTLPQSCCSTLPQAPGKTSSSASSLPLHKSQRAAPHSLLPRPQSIRAPTNQGLSLKFRAAKQLAAPSAQGAMRRAALVLTCSAAVAVGTWHYLPCLGNATSIHAHEPSCVTGKTLVDGDAACAPPTQAAAGVLRAAHRHRGHVGVLCNGREAALGWHSSGEAGHAQAAVSCSRGRVQAWHQRAIQGSLPGAQRGCSAAQHAAVAVHGRQGALGQRAGAALQVQGSPHPAGHELRWART